MFNTKVIFLLESLLLVYVSTIDKPITKAHAKKINYTLSAIPNNLKKMGIADDSLSIQYIDIKINHILYREVKKFIQEQKDSSILFRNNFGYITIGNYKINQPTLVELDSLNSYKGNIITSFTMALTSYYITDESPPSTAICHDCFPLYYSYLDGKLILIYDSNAKWIHRNTYSHSSKKLISKLVRETLLQALNPKFEFKDMYKASIYLSEDQRERMTEREILEFAAFTHNRNKTYIEYQDGTIKYRYQK